MRLLLGMMIIITTSCTEIFKTELPPIKDCTGDNDLCNYTDSIQPIFDTHCTVCHNSALPQGGLSLESHIELMRGNIVEPYDSLNSILIYRLTGEHPLSFMPPSPRTPLENSKIHMISKWIQAGAGE